MNAEQRKAASREKAKALAIKIMPETATILELRYAIDQIAELVDEVEFWRDYIKPKKLAEPA